MIIEWMKKIEILKYSQNNYEIELYKKYLANLNNKLSENQDTALEIKNYLIKEFHKKYDDPDYKLIFGVLMKIENSTLNDISNELYTSFDRLNDISNAIIRLITKN